jgi:hypothetical protein
MVETFAPRALVRIRENEIMENQTSFNAAMNEDQARSQAWTNAKEGDVFYTFSGSWTYSQAVQVERVTKTLIILENGVRLSKTTRKDSNIGYASITSYVPATPGAIRMREDAFAAKELKNRSGAALNKAAGLVSNADFVGQLEALLRTFEVKP